jgi:hypothetical protein
MTDTRNETERLLNAAMDHIADTLEQSTDPRAWDHLLIYAPTAAIFNALARRITDVSNLGSLTLGEIERGTEGAKLPAPPALSVLRADGETP